jgi:hypothetical protein
MSESNSSSGVGCIFETIGILILIYIFSRWDFIISKLDHFIGYTK